MHPYPVNLPPTTADARDPDYAEFARLPHVPVLDHVQRTYGSCKLYPIYITEYGYITNPPKRGNRLPYPRNRRPLDQLVRVPAPGATRGSPRRCSSCSWIRIPRAGVPEFGGFSRAASLFFSRKPEAGLLRLPHAVLPARHVDWPRPSAHGVGRDPPRPITPPRHPRRPAMGPDQFRAVGSARSLRSSRSASGTRAATSRSRSASRAAAP